MFHYFNEFLVIAIAHLVAVISPGPDFALIVRQTVKFNRKVAIISSIGIAFGILIHITYCILGVGYLLSSNEVLYKLFKYTCSLYLFYLGFQSLFQSKIINSNVDNGFISKKNKYNYLNAFKQGFLTNVLNIKATLFFLSLYSIINIETPKLIQLFYGFWMCGITGIWFTLVSVFFTSKIFITYISRYNIILNKIMGVVLIYIAGKIFLYY